uniref:Uncharacterized protein n=1 Tax=Panagrolaimus davidi TaxID=227884 RepID=A0A914PVY0_9BILA
MKLPLTLSFFVALIQLCTSNVLSKRGIQELLSSDKNGIQNGSDVIMVKPGPLEVILNNASELIFGVCEQNCNGEFLVCYEGAFNNSWSTDLCKSECGFYVITEGEIITYLDSMSRTKRNCTEMLIKNGTTKQKDSPINYASCLPKVDNGVVKLNIMNATSDCVVTVKNAKLKQDEIVVPSSTNFPSNNPSNNPTSAATKIIGNFGWIFVLISFFAFHQ